MRVTELRLLRAHFGISASVLSLLALTGFRLTPRAPERFTEIDVERINLVEKDGTRRLVISNRSRSPAVYTHGDTIGKAGRRAGLIFYNDSATEVGGLVFGGERETTGKVNQGLSLTFDQYDQDQVIALQHIDESGTRYQGLTVNDRPEPALIDIIHRDSHIDSMPPGPQRDSARAAWLAWQGGVAYGARRLFLGRSRDRASVVNLADPLGRTRLRLIVDSLGSAQIQFLDSTGHVTSTLPK
jgi:hypothetical protein